ncbi:MAG: aldo/keto reductase [Niabella sp.]
MYLPKVISGTSLLGNLYKELHFEEKLAIVKEYIDAVPGIPMFDSAGKYGAGLALEELSKCLTAINIAPENVLISNKLAWVRKPLITPEPTFEKGIWANLKYDAEQKISYNGIIQCYRQGKELLGNYNSQFVSVHDPDEYLAAALNDDDYKKRYDDILEAYRALQDLKKEGIINSIGIGAKDWRSIQLIEKDVLLDCVMIANSLTIYNHPKDLLDFIAHLKNKNITIINSAVFHGGFLIGSDFFNYVKLSRNNPAQQQLYNWRDKFFAICNAFDLAPATAAINFALNIPGIKSIALNSSNPQRVRNNINMATTEIPAAFWQRMKAEGLIASDYAYL